MHKRKLTEFNCFKYRNLNKLKIKYQSYAKLTKFQAFEQKILVIIDDSEDFTILFLHVLSIVNKM